MTTLKELDMRKGTARRIQSTQLQQVKGFHMGFSKIEGLFVGSPRNKVYLGIFWSPLFMDNPIFGMALKVLSKYLRYPKLTSKLMEGPIYRFVVL